MEVSADDVLRVFRDVLLDSGGSLSALANPNITLSLNNIEALLRSGSVSNLREVLCGLQTRGMIEDLGGDLFKLCPPAWPAMTRLSPARPRLVSDCQHGLAASDALFFESLAPIDSIDAEVERLSGEIAGIGTEALPFDRWDFAAVFAIGLLEVAADFLLGDPGKGLSKRLSDKNSALGKHLNAWHDGLDHSGHPIDYQGFKFGGGDHRARTFGHDLLMFPMSICQLAKGKFIDGYYQDGRFNWVETAFNRDGNQYSGMPADQAVVAYVTHMAADFLSSKGLPVPGFGLLAHLPVRDIRVLVSRMYEDGFNLRHVAVDGLPVLSTEVLMRVYFYLRNRESGATDAARKHKVNKLLLMSHGLAAAVNVGKVIIIENPALVNLPMILRVMWLAWSVCKEEAALGDRAKQRAALSSLRLKCETMKTIICLESTICYARDIDGLIARGGRDLDAIVRAGDDAAEREAGKVVALLEAMRAWREKAAGDCDEQA